MSIEILELSENEVQAITGGGQIDQSTIEALTDDYPQIENNPPG